MRNFPSVMYLRDHLVSKDYGDFRDITLASKIEIVDGVQYLVAAISVVNPLEAFITEERDTQNGLDSFPVPVDPPRGKYPFVKAEGRANALGRLEKAIARLKMEGVSFRDKGVIAISNNEDRIANNIVYVSLSSCLHLDGRVLTFLEMSHATLNDITLSLFQKEGGSQRWGDYIDIGYSFNSTSI